MVPTESPAVFPGLSAEAAAAWAHLALDNVVREYPHHVQHLMTGDYDHAPPRVRHPAFFGSFDWHSAVHMHWLLARVLRRHPQLPPATRIVARLDTHLAPAAIAGECAYLERPGAAGFERPYGWAWALALQAELDAAIREAGPCVEAFMRWREALRPMTGLLADRLETFLPLARLPVRTGTHGNTAFALLLSVRGARALGRRGLVECCRERLLQWHAREPAAPLHWEPAQDEFLSPVLMLAVALADVLDPPAARAWLARFLPPEAALRDWLRPPVPADRDDGKLAHLDGLALSRAWCMRRLLASGACHPALAEAFHEAVPAHLASALPQVTGGRYAGTHWLASFAALAMDDL